MQSAQLLAMWGPHPGPRGRITLCPVASTDLSLHRLDAESYGRIVETGAPTTSALSCSTGCWSI